MKHKGRARWVGLYTAIYLFVAALMGAMLFLGRRTLIWNPDGLKQHYNVVGYVGRVLRDLLKGHLPAMMSFHLGQGLDVLTTCSYYGYTDPLNWLAAFAGNGQIEIAYTAVDFLRLYLTGLAFGAYARKVGCKDGWATGCAAAIYVFGGYCAWMIGRHPYFINGALYLPLLLLGVERVFEDRRWLMFTLTAALMLIVNFYFAYMNTVIAVVYILVRLIFRLKPVGVKKSAGDGFLLLGAYLLGALLSAVVFVPIVGLYIGNSRLGVQAGYSGSMLHYAREWYRDIAVDLFAPWKTPGNYLLLNYAPLALFALMALLTLRGGRARQMRVGLFLSAACACVPMAGRVLNGMAYVSNRWSYAVALFVALGCAAGLPRLFKADFKGRKVIAILALVYAAALAVYNGMKRDLWQLLAPLFIALTAALILLYDGGKVKWLTRAAARRLTAALLAASCAAYVVVGYLPRGYQYIHEQTKRHVYSSVESRAGAQLIEDDGVYRTAQGRFDDPNSLLLDYMGVSFYWSLVDGMNSQYYMDLNLPAQTTTYHIYGLGASAGMNAVAAVKYFVQHDGSEYVVPYGFEPTGEALTLPDGTGAALYENTLALPLGYAYDASLSRREYDALSAPEKLQALVRAAILEEDAPQSAQALPGAEPVAGAVEVPWTLAGQTDAELTDTTLGGGEGGRLTLTFDAPEDSEVYLLIDDLALAPEHLSKSVEGEVNVVSEQGVSFGFVPHPYSNFYFPKRNFAYCIGSGALKGCDIVFGNALDYTYSAIRVVALPLSAYREDALARRAEALEDVRLSQDGLSGSITTAGNRILQIAVPYSKGWRAWVDGVEQPVFRCGGMYMGVALDAGTHAIEMRYETPGLRLGALISLIALAATVALAIWDGARRRRRRA